MRKIRREVSARVRRLVLGVPAGMVLAAAIASAQQPDPAADVQGLRRELEIATRELERLRASFKEQERKLRENREALEAQYRLIEQMQVSLGAGRPSPGADAPAMTTAALAGKTGRGLRKRDKLAQNQVEEPGTQQTQPENPPQTVGEAPAQPQQSAPPQIAPIFDVPGVLTPKGKFVLEPAFEYAYLTTNRASVIGFEIFPALLIGVLDIRAVQRSFYTLALTGRYGLTNRLEVEARVPYVYRTETLQTREFLNASFVDSSFYADGQGLGDVELTARYQLNQGGIDKPYYVGTLRVRVPTGKDPFEVDKNLAFPRGSGRFLELPTGTGFYSIQPELTVIYPTDPLVLFGTLKYAWTVKRTNVTDGAGQTFSEIDPGDVFGFNFGMGLALNERASFSVGYEHLFVGKTTVNGRAPGDLNVQLGTLQVGYSYKLTTRTTLNVSIGVGVTEDSQDVQLTFRLPTML